MYVLRRSDDGAFVARLGLKSSYTKNLIDARKFATCEQAESERCGNETIVELERVLDTFRQ